MNDLIKNVLELLISNGYEAYIVGGYVRDRLLSIDSFDVDICTDALPDKVCELFNVSNHNYGCVSFILGRYFFDITTYRRELLYVKRKPVNMEYIDSLDVDLVRRDFTINSICMDVRGRYVDKLGGMNDLNHKCIKLIGEYDKKFSEDPLRILRAIRFMCVYNMFIDEYTMEGIYKYGGLLEDLSVFSVRFELDKILLSEYYDKGIKLLCDLGFISVGENMFRSHNLLVMYAQINISDKYFTKNELIKLNIYRNIFNCGKIDYDVLSSYGLDNVIDVCGFFSSTRDDVMKIFEEE